jgi:hypothetical protein
MKSPKIDYFMSSLPSLSAGLVAIALLATTSISLAVTDTDTIKGEVTAEPAALVYVDSVKTWGAWNLDIQPAAGGIATPSVQPIKARGTQLRLRTNSFTALAPIHSGAGNSPVAPPAVFTPPPMIPPPNITPPIGGPTDGLF